MDKKMYFCTIVLLLLANISGPTLAIISIRPDNMADIQGNNVTMTCAVSNSTTVSWFHSGDGLCLSNTGCNTSLIYGLYNKTASEIKKDFLGRYSIDTTNGAQNLVISGAQLEDTGYFACVDTSTEPVSYSIASLTLLETISHCIGNYSYIEDEMMTFECTVDFQGSLAPSMNFKSSEYDTLGDQTTNVTLVNSTVFYTHGAPATRQLHGQAVYCHTYFNPPSSVPTLAATYSNTTPGYASNVYCGTLLVAYCLLCSNISHEVQAGQNILCSIDSNPPGIYTWTDLTGGAVLTYTSTTKGSSLSTDQLIFGYQYQCTVCAACLRSTVDYNCCNQTFTIVQEDIRGAIIGGTLSGIFIVTAFVLFVILLTRHENNMLQKLIPAYPKKKKVPTATLR